jgi:hypothetical protein
MGASDQPGDHGACLWLPVGEPGEDPNVECAQIDVGQIAGICQVGILITDGPSNRV